MKPEISYDAIVNYQLAEEAQELIISYIYDLIGDIEYNMKMTSLRDDYFNQLSIEKFTLETIIREIINHSDISPFAVIERFVERAHKGANESTHPSSDYTFSVSRDAAMSILDSFYFGYLGYLQDECDEFEP